MKLISYKISDPSLVGNCKSQYFELIRRVTKEYKPDVLNFDKSEQCLDHFLWNHVGIAPSFTDLCKVLRYFCLTGRLK